MTGESEESLAAAWGREVPEARQREFREGLSEEEHARVRALWRFWARRKQQPPDGDWRVWLMLAGRGYGKTRAGAEWVRDAARHGTARIALVGATIDDACAVMVEGDSGVLAVCTGAERPRWEASRRRLSWASGARATVFSGESPDLLRGPEHSHAWCDELAKWGKPDETWSNLEFTLRRGPRQAVLVTTTPRPIPLLVRLVADPKVRTTWGRTRDNLMLPASYVEAVEAAYAGTRLGRQELDGELLVEVEGSLFPRAWFERGRVPAILPGAGRGTATRSGVVEGRLASPCLPLHHASHGPPPRSGEELGRIVVGVDPPASAGGDACGIVAMGLGRDGVALVLEDASVEGASPEGWARAVALCAARWAADRVVAEANQGGDMVRSVLRAGGLAFPVTLVHATRGKAVRAEPVALHYEAGRVRHAGCFPKLEDQLTGMTRRGYEGPGRSPDRADALIWAATELLVKPARAEPRIVSF